MKGAASCEARDTNSASLPRACQGNTYRLFRPKCGTPVGVKDRDCVGCVDLPYAGTPSRLSWYKRRLLCPNPDCEATTWTHTDHRIATKDCGLTTLAAE